MENEKSQKRREHTFVIYALGGEHMMIMCDLLSKTTESVKLYNRDEDDNSNETLDLIAEFFSKNIIGWEQIR